MEEDERLRVKRDVWFGKRTGNTRLRQPLVVVAVIHCECKCSWLLEGGVGGFLD